jgi:uncharacterized protein YdhG (YjbR/CyaY superfamily)
MICEALRKLITAVLPDAASKVWHGSPVWFKDENPIVGYNATAKTVILLFWNGQAFGDPDLRPVGKYRAAQAVFGDVAEIDSRRIRLWLKKARSNVFDSKAFFKKLREEQQTLRPARTKGEYAMPAKPTTIDEYFAKAGADHRVALQKLRKTIRATVPQVQECINYGVAAFRLDGKCIAGLGAAAKHCSYYPMSGAVVAKLCNELKAYTTTKGAIQFEPTKPLPASLIRKLLKARIAEIDKGSKGSRK